MIVSRREAAAVALFNHLFAPRQAGRPDYRWGATEIQVMGITRVREGLLAEVDVVLAAAGPRTIFDIIVDLGDWMNMHNLDLGGDFALAVRDTHPEAAFLSAAMGEEKWPGLYLAPTHLSNRILGMRVLGPGDLRGWPR